MLILLPKIRQISKTWPRLGIEQRMEHQMERWLTRMVALLSGVFAIFILTAPPVMIEIVRATGTASFPLPYLWVMALLESDFGGPLIWYFNDVWSAGIVFIGEETPPPVHVVLIYALAAVVLFVLMTLPFWTRRRLYSVNARKPKTL